MAYLSSELAVFPTTISELLTDVKETPIDPVRVVQFHDSKEQRISYSGTIRKRFMCEVSLMWDNEMDEFISFWAARNGSLTPFKFTFKGVLYYCRFDGTYSLEWLPGYNASLSFSLIQVDNSEIVVDE